MKTVKEVSELTGISVRTLHWYDEIGLFNPTVTSAAGYRLYDDKALETLQQILFFREFDMPLKGMITGIFLILHPVKKGGSIIRRWWNFTAIRKV